MDFAEKYRTAPVQLDEDARNRLINYPWPGNVRELKNIAEQISVLSTDKSVTAKTLSRFLPENNMNRLPVLVQSNGSGTHEFANEREILYKLFFDMKKDVTELKKLFFEVIQNPAVLHQNPNIVNDMKELQPHHEYPSPVLMHQTNPQPSQRVIMHKDIHDEAATLSCHLRY